jgi:hypothetical protein
LGTDPFNGTLVIFCITGIANLLGCDGRWQLLDFDLHIAVKGSYSLTAIGWIWEKLKVAGNERAWHRFTSLPLSRPLVELVVVNAHLVKGLHAPVCSAQGLDVARIHTAPAWTSHGEFGYRRSCEQTSGHKHLRTKPAHCAVEARTRDVAATVPESLNGSGKVREAIEEPTANGCDRTTAADDCRDGGHGRHSAAVAHRLGRELLLNEACQGLLTDVEQVPTKTALKHLINPAEKVIEETCLTVFKRHTTSLCVNEACRAARNRIYSVALLDALEGSAE